VTEQGPLQDSPWQVEVASDPLSRIGEATALT
jgi:hypothetical protein